MGQQSTKEKDNNKGNVVFKSNYIADFSKYSIPNKDLELDDYIKQLHKLHNDTMLKILPKDVFEQIMNYLIEDQKSKRVKACVFCYKEAGRILYEWTTVATSELPKIPNCCYGNQCIRCLCYEQYNFVIKKFYTCPEHLMNAIEKLERTEVNRLWKLQSCIPKVTLPYPNQQISPPKTFRSFDFSNDKIPAHLTCSNIKIEEQKEKWKRLAEQMLE
jgi:hypothetical protein